MIGPNDWQLRDECLYCLALIARLGGAPLLQPVGMFVNLLGGVHAPTPAQQPDQ